MNLRQQIRQDFLEVWAETNAVRNVKLGGTKCEAIRTAVMLNPEATVADVIAALPDVNPSTIKIQYRQSRRISAELDALI